MNLKLSPIKTEDLPAITEIAKTSLPYDPISEPLIHEKIFEEPAYDAELTIKVENDGEIVGFLAGHVADIFDKRCGMIKLLAVAPQHRLGGIGSIMLETFESKAKEKGAQVSRTMDSIPNFLMPGIDPRYTPALILFERRGYKHVDERINMYCSLAGLDTGTEELEARAAQKGLVVRRAVESDRDALNDFLSGEFESWKAECAATFKNDPISLFVGCDGDKIIAFAAYDANNRNTGWFGPMGTNPNYRGSKLGEITLKKCMAAFQEQGKDHSIIPWVGPVGFYSRTVGAFIERLFWVFEKPLT